MVKYERIRELREEYEYTQEYLANRLNVSQRAYSRYENGERSLPTEALIEIANIYNTSTDFLLNRTNKKEPY